MLPLIFKSNHSFISTGLPPCHGLGVVKFMEEIGFRHQEYCFGVNVKNYSIPKNPCTLEGFEPVGFGFSKFWALFFSAVRSLRDKAIGFDHRFQLLLSIVRNLDGLLWKETPPLWDLGIFLLEKIDASEKLRSTNLQQLLPWKLTCPLKINGWKMYSLLK